MYQERTYRNLVDTEKLVSFPIVVEQTDLLVHAEKNLMDVARDLVLEHRAYVEGYIRTYPEFVTTHDPWKIKAPAPNIVADMIHAGARAGVGPMAAIAGAIAEHLGRGLLNHTEQVIVENGGDVFIKVNRPVTVGIFAGASPLSMQIGLKLNSAKTPAAVCTSSGTVGHSVSLGRADAVCVVADSCALADAAATAIGNRIQSPADIDEAIAAARRIDEIIGIVIIVGQKIGVWGQLNLISLAGKKG